MVKTEDERQRKPFIKQNTPEIIEHLYTGTFAPSELSAKERPSIHHSKEAIFTTEEKSSKLSYTSGRGNYILIYEGHRYIKNNTHSGKTYWKCTKWHSGCKARAITNVITPDTCQLKNTHNHDL